MIYTDFKAGFVSIIGRPNSGKSTLMNRILGNKLAIISPKPQTTRDRILGIYREDKAQIVFLDTPGLTVDGGGLKEHFIKVIDESIKDSDIVLLLDDVTRETGGEEFSILRNIAENNKDRLIAAINKIDAVPASKVEERYNQFTALFPGTPVHRISALRGDGLSVLKRDIIDRLPFHPPYYDGDELSDLPERFFAAETIREKAFHFLREEVPYGLAVTVENFKETEDKVEIDAFLIVEKKSHKGIVIGKGGSMIKKIGTAAREEFEKIYDKKVILRLLVKVMEGWTKDPFKRKLLGYG